MEAFEYTRAADAKTAIARVAAAPQAAYLAGGTSLVDLMKLHVESPRVLVDVNRLPLAQIDVSDASIRVGAMVRNSDLAWNDAVRQRLPALSEAILSGASPQLRNVATVGGNVMQRTRCYYFRDGVSPCNKRQPGAGCAALEGFNRIHAVLGVSEKCIATHPSDMCVALAALDAIVHVQGPSGDRKIPINEFYVAYGDDPAKETVLAHGELITVIEIPTPPWLRRSHYLKVRDRESYEFALASAAVALDLSGKTIKAARLALGGVASKPWRSLAAEKLLVERGASPESFAAAAGEALRGAAPREHNAFKVELARRTLVRALETAAAIQ